MEHRRIFVTLNAADEPQGYVWALCADPADFDDADPRMPKQNGASEEQRTSWCCALTEQQVTDGWTAVPSEWRRVPLIAQHVQHANAAASLVGRELRVGGVKIDLDERGTSRGAGQEPDCPCGTLASQAELQALVDAVGSAISYQNRANGEHVLTEPTPA